MENATSSALILVVDDEELIRMFVREALERPGFEVCEASNGSQAVEQCISRYPGLIVMVVVIL